jgi:alginate O-acetyltransferase complex protein AlgI
MLFNSQIFILVFLPVVLALYYWAADRRWLRQSIVIIASLGFYAYWNVRFVPLLAGLTLVNYLIVYLHGRHVMRGLPMIGVAINLLVLCVFKYANFIGANVAALLGRPFHAWDIILPLGISFFVFQKISYLIDLRRGDRHIYGFLDFCMFVTFFPQLIAGPLVRHNEIIDQFRASPRNAQMWENLGRGFVLFLLGVIKKAGIADTVALVCDPLFQKAASGGLLNAAEAWAAATTYTLQIYFDFSGYSDMAIGLGLMFGLRLPFNFDAPYRSRSIREFWRRWHMTLSRFLRDYLYIPLGGNRRGPWRQAVNVVVTMLLGGLWHGASWTFVAWGGLHGVALALNGAWNRLGLRLPQLAGWGLTMLFVIAGWVLFRSPDFGTAAHVLESMAGLHGIGRTKVDNALVVELAAVLAVFGPTSQRLALEMARPSPWLAVPVGVVTVLALLLIGGRIPNEFIYFQF